MKRGNVVITWHECLDVVNLMWEHPRIFHRLRIFMKGFCIYYLSIQKGSLIITYKFQRTAPSVQFIQMGQRSNSTVDRRWMLRVALMSLHEQSTKAYIVLQNKHYVCLLGNVGEQFKNLKIYLRVNVVFFSPLKPWTSQSAAVSTEAVLEGTAQMVTNCFLSINFQGPLLGMNFMAILNQILLGFLKSFKKGLKSFLQHYFDLIVEKFGQAQTCCQLPER